MVALLFWFSLLTIIYVYLGYPLLISLFAWLRPKPVQRKPIEPAVTLLIAAYNEEHVIQQKIENSLALDYPRNKLEIVVVADGSNDRTCDVVRDYADRRIVLYFQSERVGKVGALNRVVPLTGGEIILFSDANNLYRRDAVRKLVRNFADPTVGAAIGKKVLYQTGSALGTSENLYWGYESFVQHKESQLSSTTGALGEILAIRRTLWTDVPESVINEDFFLALRVMRQGYRVVYEPEALSEEMPVASAKGEIARRSRIAAGFFQAWLALPRWLGRASPLIYVQAISHSLLRPVIPFFMIVALVTNMVLVTRLSHVTGLIGVLAVAQASFYLLAVGGAGLAKLGLNVKPFYLPYIFCISNLGCAIGFGQFVLRRHSVLWAKVQRERCR